MSWTFTKIVASGPAPSITVRNPEFADIDRNIRRQARGTTDGGVVFVEDLGETDEFLEVEFRNLKSSQVSDMKNFFGPAGVNSQEKPFSIQATENHFLQILTTDTIIDGVALNTDQGFNTDQFVNADTTTFAQVFLDQPNLDFTQDRFQRSSIAMRFRLSMGALPEIL